MKNTPPPPRRTFRSSGFGDFALNAALVLIAINLVFFVASLAREDIIARLGLAPYLFSERPWTLLTAIFVHSGFWHLFGNMIILYFFGTVLVRFIGNNWFLLVYFVGGLVGNALYLWLGEYYSLSLGASGAVYAITAALVVMVPNMRIALWGIIPMPLWVFVVVLLVLFSLPSYFGTTIAWQAHLGGLAVGLIAGFFFRRRIRVNFYR